METGLWGAIAYLAQAVSLHGIDGVAQDAGKSGFICALVCLVVPVLEAMIGKMPTSRTWIAAGVATVGIGLLEMGDMAPGAGGLSSSDLVSLLQPIGFGLGFWRMETFSRKVGLLREGLSEGTTARPTTHRPPLTAHCPPPAVHH